MTVANTNVSSTYNCNGVTREWNIGFHYNPTLSGLDIVVLHADGTSTTVTANYEIESGVLTYPTVESELDPLPEGDVITITRITPLTQNINLVQQGPLDAEILESGYDKATIQIQEVASKKQDKLKAGANISIDPDGTISATGEIVEGVNWGNIHGTLSNQTDLLAALNAKADGSDLNSYVAKAGSTMTGDLSITKEYASVNLTNSNNKKYTVMANENGNLDIKLDSSNGKGLFLNGQDNEAPYYNDGTNAYRLLNTTDKSTLETSIANKADKDLSNLTSGLSNTICITAATTTSTASSATPAVVVENYVNGTSWYRIWSDGWCEQGGRITGTSITFLQSFVDTNYSFSGVSINANSGGAASTVTNLATTGCTYYTYGNAGGMWQACGYIR